MSDWTRVAGIIRIDALPFEVDPYEVIQREFGVISTYEQPDPMCTMPTGSEGSLRYEISEYRQPDFGMSVVWGHIAIWGDLRDYDSIGEIAKWFTRVLDRMQGSRLGVRDAVMKVVNKEHGVILTLVEDNEGNDYVTIQDAPSSVPLIDEDEEDVWEEH